MKILKKFMQPVNLLLVILIIAGFTVGLLRPDWVLEGKTALNIQIEKRHYCNSFSLIDNPNYDMLMLANSAGNVDVLYQNQNNDHFAQRELSNYKVYSHLIERIDNNAWFCLINRDLNSYLFKAFDDEGNIGPIKYLIQEDPWKSNLLRSYSVFDDTIKVNLSSFEDPDKTYIIDVFNDSISISIEKDLLNNLISVPINQVEFSPIYCDLSSELTENSGRNFTNQDIYRLIAEKRRASWYKDSLNSDRWKTLFNGTILEVCDIDNDGDDDFIIYIDGSRFAPSYLLCYNPTKERVLWEKPFYCSPKRLKVTDIDNDGFLEMIVVFYANGIECSADWFDFDIRLESTKSYVAVFDNNCQIKSYNGHEALLETGNFTTYSEIQVLPSGKILTAITTDYDDSLKNLLLVDFFSNRIDTLDITYQQAEHLQEFGENIEFIYKKEGKLTKDIINSDLAVINSVSIDIENRTNLKYITKFTLFDKEYTLLRPCNVLDDKFNLIYQNEEFLSFHNIQIKDNIIYFLDGYKEKPYLLKKMTINENHQINSLYIEIWLILILILITYRLTSIFFRIPQKEVDGSYAVLYRFAGFLYNWRIFGKTSVYTQPVVMSMSPKRFHDIMKDICENYQLLTSRNLGLVQLSVYKLFIGNEMHIIQRIAHDIKNQVHLANLKLGENSDGDLEESMRMIFDKSAMLSDFSRINLMQKTEIDLICLIDTILIKFSSHKRYNDILWEPEEAAIKITADENLIQIAIINILKNAIDYSPDDSQIAIIINADKSSVNINITNQINPDITETQKGSGIGLMATEKIITAHGGEFRFQKTDNATVEIILYK
ncbi:MAG: hypothetical protein K9N06_01965 [Candidatus Cloacimonetes bacterium]|nr:hypothetical protein [Candidatus Cloacimonadota bacterium]